MTFLENLEKKLPYAFEAKLIPLDSVVESTITTANTVTTLVNYASPKLSGFDVVEAGYLIQINNQSGAGEDFTIVLDLGGTSYSAGVSADTMTNVDVKVELKAVKSFNDNHYVTATITDSGSNIFSFFTIESSSSLTNVIVTVENDSTVGATCTVGGYGGYILVDNVERV